MNIIKHTINDLQSTIVTQGNTIAVLQSNNAAQGNTISALAQELEEYRRRYGTLNGSTAKPGVKKST